MKTLTMTETQWVSGGCPTCPAGLPLCAVVAASSVAASYYGLGEQAAIYAVAAILTVTSGYILYHVLNENEGAVS